MDERFELRVTGTAPGTPAALRRWLSRDPQLRGLLSTHWAQETSPRDPEVLGDSLAVLGIVLSGVLALPAFADSVRRWFTTRPPSSAAITVRRGDTVVTLPSGASAEEIVAILGALDNSPPEPDGAPDED
ncbi:hypothetical protein ACFYT4_01875 [Streptomyces sp. NPDC004609]|uniref:effector-associated constant component EACC1 n=1 Tax=Streptomyces sp. NPDC004609 TaxID=3364704 RepID=UPI0036C966FC